MESPIFLKNLFILQYFLNFGKYFLFLFSQKTIFLKIVFLKNFYKKNFF